MKIQAVLAGLCAALASVFAKLAMSSAEAERMCTSASNVLSYIPFVGQTQDTTQFWCRMLWCMRIIFFALVFVCNALMWRFYVKSLQYSSSTFLPTVTNTASNFFFTALFGWFLFDEMLSLMWFAGMTLVFLGLALIHRDQVQSCTVSTESKKTK